VPWFVQGRADREREGVGGQDRERHRGGPAPSSCTRSAQNGWSASTGTVTAGTPARSPAPVVPAPA
jgi:hypothetical protein